MTDLEIILARIDILVENATVVSDALTELLRRTRPEITPDPESPDAQRRKIADEVLAWASAGSRYWGFDPDISIYDTDQCIDSAMLASHNHEWDHATAWCLELARREREA